MSEQCMKSCCMCFTGEPVESKDGKIQVRTNPNMWQVNMCDSCYSDGCCGNAMIWGLCQFCPFTCCCTQVCFYIVIYLADFDVFFNRIVSICKIIVFPSSQSFGV